jgi:hypothetical protein
MISLSIISGTNNDLPKVCKPFYVVAEPRHTFGFTVHCCGLFIPGPKRHPNGNGWCAYLHLVYPAAYHLSCSVLSCFPTRAPRRCEQIKLILAKRTNAVILVDAAHGSAVQTNCASKHFSCPSHNQTYSNHATSEPQGGRQSCQCPQPLCGTPGVPSLPKPFCLLALAVAFVYVCVVSEGSSFDAPGSRNWVPAHHRLRLTKKT